MRYLLLLCLAGCASHNTSYNSEDPNLEFDDPVLNTCIYKLEKKQVDDEVLECYINTIKELQNEHSKKDY